ncbi:FecR domain-containing protein [Thauera linaloolentis]|nr:FecR domain-containing protein [Thauera linaloolentis]MCM8566347.1 FecR domain-containing protein [Thauera linaloolentis]
MNAPAHVSPMDERIAIAAAEWYFRLQEGASPDEQTACAAWRAADPRHELAWQRAEQLGKTLAGLPPQLALPTLNRKRANGRRNAAKALALLLCAAPAGWLAWNSQPARERLAEHRTATGQRREITLADGTRLHLNTASAVDVRYDAHARVLQLHAGEILVDTALDSYNPPRPLRVETRHGAAHALGTRFTLRQEADHTRVSVLAGAVRIQPAGSQEHLILQPGQQARFTQTTPGTPQDADPQGAEWTRGLLIARNMRLGDFAAELARHRAGLLRCDPAVADQRISGAFQLDDTDAILASLPRAIPIQVHYRSRYWVTLTPAGTRH